MGLFTRGLTQLPTYVTGFATAFGSMFLQNTPAEETYTIPKNRPTVVSTVDSPPNQNIYFPHLAITDPANNVYGPFDYLAQFILDKFYERQVKEDPLGELTKLKAEYSFKFYHTYEGMPYEKQILTRAVNEDPYNAVSFFTSGKFDPAKFKDLQDQASSMVNISNKLRTHIGSDGFRKRQRFLSETIGITNNNFCEALNEFNRTGWDRMLLLEKLNELGTVREDLPEYTFYHGNKKPLLLIPLGIRKNPYEFVFVGLGKGGPPIRIGISFNELQLADSKEKITNLLNAKVEKGKSELASLTDTDYSYKIPGEGKTGCVFVCIPHHLQGIESDILTLIQIYNDDYGATIYGICMEDREKWLKTITDNPLPLSNADFSGKINMLFPYSATENDVLKNIEISAKRAINDGKSALVIHYLMHGTADGQVSAKDSKLVSPEKLIDTLTAQYKGKPISDQIDIIIAATSCHSGKQLDTMIASLQDKNTYVKNLRIITDSNYTTSWAGTTIHNASIPSDHMSTDRSATSLYNLSCYRETLNGLRDKGIEIPREFESLPYMYQFVRALSTIDSPTGQVLQAVHYRNNPEDVKVTHLLKRF